MGLRTAAKLGAILLPLLGILGCESDPETAVSQFSSTQNLVSSAPTVSSISSSSAVSSAQSSSSVSSSANSSNANNSSVSSQTNTDFYIESSWPTANSENIALVSQISVELNTSFQLNQSADEILTVNLDGTNIPGSVSVLQNRQIRFIPNTLLSPNRTYQIHLASISADNGARLQATSWQFTTTLDVHTTSQAVIDQCMSTLDIAMLDAVNQARAVSRICDDGEPIMPAVNKLAWDCNLQAAAIGHSQDMATNDFFSHTGSDGLSPSNRVTNAGYQWRATGENIAAGQRSVSQVMQGWLDSPGHCANIMAPVFTEFGFGYAENASTLYRTYWTQNFGTPW